MKHPVLVRAVTATTVAALLAGFGAASASAEPAAFLTVSPLQPLTLPAGDGVRDSQQVTIAANLATTVTVAIRYQSGETIADLGSVEIADPATAATVAVNVAGLPAATLELVATPAGGEPTVQTFSVGSGEARSVDLSLSAPVIYTWTGATPRSTVATVTAYDETELAVPFTGTVKAVVGGKTYNAPVTSTTGASAKATIAVSKLAVGAGPVTATVKGTGALTTTSEPVALTVRSTAVKSVTIARAVATVYPYKDSYRDSVKFTIKPTSTTGKSIPATGKVTITRNGKVVKSWSLTSSSATSRTWDGRVGGKIVAGTYYVKVSLKGPEGTTKTATTSVVVSGKRLVTKTKSITYLASTVFTAYAAYDYNYYGECYRHYITTGDVFCRGYDAYDVASLSLMVTGKVSIPTAVRDAQKYAPTYAKVTINVASLTGSAAWAYDSVKDGAAKVGALKVGIQNLGSHKLKADATKVYVNVGLGEYSKFRAKTVTVKYAYKVLVS